MHRGFKGFSNGRLKGLREKGKKMAGPKVKGERRKEKRKRRKGPFSCFEREGYRF